MSNTNDNSKAPYVVIQLQVLEDTQVRSEALKALIMVSTNKEYEDLLNSLYTFGHHYIATYLSNNKTSGIKQLKTLCHAYHYSALLLDLVDEYNEEVVNMTNTIISLCKQQGGLRRIINELRIKLKEYKKKTK